MDINNCRSINYDESLLQRTLNYVDRFSTEKAYCEYEKVGRLITLYGAMNEAAALMEDLEKASRLTLLPVVNFDLIRMKALFEGMASSMKTVFGMIGHETFPDEQFFVFNVRRKTPEERREKLALAIETYQPDICFVDGIADLMTDINSGPDSVELMQQLLTLASVNHCNIVSMIHLNRSGDKLNLRGWIGTVLVQKAYEAFNCDKMDQTKTFSVELTFSRRYYQKQALYYGFDEDGIPCITDDPKGREGVVKGRLSNRAEDEKKTFNQAFVDEQSGNPYLPWNYCKLFDTAMGGASSLSYDEMARRVMELGGIRSRQYYDKVLAEAERLKVVKKVLDCSGRVTVIMMPC